MTIIQICDICKQVMDNKQGRYIEERFNSKEICHICALKVNDYIESITLKVSKI